MQSPSKSPGKICCSHSFYLFLSHLASLYSLTLQRSCTKAQGQELNAGSLLAAHCFWSRQFSRCWRFSLSAYSLISIDMSDHDILCSSIFSSLSSLRFYHSFFLL